MSGRRDTDENLSVAEKRAIYLKRYGLVGGLTLIAPMFIPTAMEWLAGNVMDNKLKPLVTEVRELKSEVLYSRAYSSVNHMQTLIDADDWNTLIRHRIRSQSLDKVKQIQNIIDDGYEGHRLWNKVRNILYYETNIYVTEMKQYGHPVAGNMARYLSNTFPMVRNPKRKYRPDYSFMEVVREIIVSREIPKEHKASDILEYMKAIQDEYFTDHYAILKKMEQEAKVRR